MLLAAGQAGSAGQAIGLFLPIIFVFFFGYFFVMKPQKKQESRQKELLESIEVGDSVLTTSGFYGMIIDIQDDTVIVEFGNNKNCRIPMQKRAIVDVEKTEA